MIFGTFCEIWKIEEKIKTGLIESNKRLYEQCVYHVISRFHLSVTKVSSS